MGMKKSARKRGEKAAPPYRMRLSLNVLNHLGIYLYSNTAAVLSEVVANAWDADAENVTISIDIDAGKVIVQDDGDGMNLEEINKKYLLVGYEKRKSDPLKTKKGREPMGRKGIGKLSLFSIASTVKIMTLKDRDRHAFKMTLTGIEAAMKAKSGDNEYHPEPMDKKLVTHNKGTRIELEGLKKRLSQTPAALRKRLARRFAVIGAKHKFQINLNGETIGVDDRDYFHKLQFLWTYDDSEVAGYCKNLETFPDGKGNLIAAVEKRDSKIASLNRSIRGWIGTVRESGQLRDDDKESLNKISVMMRGKLAHEDILEDFGEGGLYTKYLIGELQADFLDDDSEEDIATSSRQSIMEDAPRYIALRDFVRKELSHIQNQWTTLRNQKGEEEALKIPAIETWYKTLEGDSRKRAKKLFGQISQMTVDEPSRRRLLKFGVLAFENLRLKDKLEALDNVSLENAEQIVGLFGEMADIEATFYHQIVSQRVQVIKTLNDAVDQNVKEKVIQEHVFDHLWLLDPSWERATDDVHMEKRVEGIFGEIDAKLTAAERTGRLDIKYRLISGKHVIVELKRAGRVVDTPELLQQIMKYHSAVTKVLAAAGRSHEPFEFLCIVGEPLSDWTDPSARERSRQSMLPYGARVLQYDELMSNAYNAYSEFLSKEKEAGKLMQLIKQIEPEDNS
jgi:hypothetical protein